MARLYLVALTVLALVACRGDGGGPEQQHGSDTVDDDHDGLSEAEGDCDDGDALIYPGAPERCNGVDDDCGGIIDAQDDEIGYRRVEQPCGDGLSEVCLCARWVDCAATHDMWTLSSSWPYPDCDAL